MARKAKKAEFFKTVDSFVDELIADGIQKKKPRAPKKTITNVRNEGKRYGKV